MMSGSKRAGYGVVTEGGIDRSSDFECNLARQSDEKERNQAAIAS